MKKIITLSAAIFAATSLFSQTIIQTNFSSWTAGDPDGWKGSRTSATVSQFPPVASPALRGGLLAQIVNQSSSHKRFTNVGVPVAAGNYEVKVWYYADSTVDLRINFYDGSYGTYNGYKIIPAASVPTSGIYSDTLTVSSAATAGEFILSLRNTNSTGLGIDSIAITKLGGTAPPPATYLSKTIYDIQFTTDASGDSPYKDSLVETSGIVTGLHGSKFFLQDGTGAWNGVYVYNFVSTPAVAVGDNITIKGKVAEYFGLTQVKDIDTIIVNSTGNTLPAAAMLNSSTMQDEQYEGCLVKLTGATCVNPSAGFGEWDVLNATDTGVIDDLMYAYTPVLGTNYDVTGLMYYSFGEYKLEPRDTTDISLTPTISINEISNELNLSVFPNPVSNYFTIEGVNLGTAEIMNAEGKIVRTISLNYITPIDVSDLTNGVYIIKVISENKVGFTRFVKQ
ncbi:MAG: T9SS type A sorting domain-containing protein [Flavobacteriales bacterium]